MDLEQDQRPPSAVCKQDLRPTYDQLYLAERLETDRGSISIAALQRLNKVYGVQVVTDALRYMRGFCVVENPYPYLVRVCQGMSA